MYFFPKGPKYIDTKTTLKQTSNQIKEQKANRRYLVVLIKESKSPGWVQLLDSLDKAVSAKRHIRAVRGLDSDAGTRVIRLNNCNARRMQVLEPDRDGLEKIRFLL